MTAIMSESVSSLEEAAHRDLACPVNHIVPLCKPKENILDIVNIQEIIDVCVYMKFTDSDIGYAAHFPNHLEKD